MSAPDPGQGDPRSPGPQMRSSLERTGTAPQNRSAVHQSPTPEPGRRLPVRRRGGDGYLRLDGRNGGDEDGRPGRPLVEGEGLITFLFTDIAESTRLWEEQPEAMRVALERHDMALR